VKGHEGLARVDADAELDRLLLGPVANREGRAHRPLRVVLVGDRGAEDRHHRVADELLDRAAEALELALEPRVVRTEQRRDVLRVHALGARGEAGQVGEEDGHHLALATHGHAASLRRRRATTPTAAPAGKP
jgi:hypothetical protein